MYTPFAPDYAQKLRKKMCDDCVHIDKKTNRCRECGCFIALKIKLARTRCPINRWGQVRD